MPLSKEDFGGLSADVDAYLSEHHKQVKRIAMVTDTSLAGIAELLAKHFTSAEIRHFPFADDIKALEWLRVV